MSEKRGIAAVIVAAGNSERFGKNKLDGFICGIPCIALTLLAFEKSEETLQTVVVTKKENIEKILLLKKLYGLKKLFAVTEGGDCRQESAAKGAAATDPAIDFIAVHDGARPLVLPEDIDRVAKEAYSHGAAAAVIRQTNTVKTVEGGFIMKTIPREDTVMSVTPQIFSREIYGRITDEFRDRFKEFTDDSAMAEKLGIKVKAVFCSDSNIKITTPNDIIIANALLSEILKKRDMQ